MNVNFWCARCGQAYSAPREMAARRARCRVCGLVQRVPEPLAPPADASSYDLAPVPRVQPQARPAERPELEPGTKRTQRRPWANRLRDFTEEASHLQGLSILLVLLSVADLFMTFLLLQASPRFYESNPVALWVFQRWNIAGMAIFKFTVTGTAIALGEYIERRRAG